MNEGWPNHPIEADVKGRAAFLEDHPATLRGRAKITSHSLRSIL